MKKRITIWGGVLSVLCIVLWNQSMGGEVGPSQLTKEEMVAVERTLRPEIGELLHDGLRLKLAGIQELLGNRYLYVLSSEAFQKREKTATYLRYFCVLRAGAKPSYTYIGDFWSIKSETPFSGGSLVEGLPIIHDAIDPDKGYSHYVYWEGRYRNLRDLPREDMYKVIDQMFKDPRTYKYLLDGSEGKSRFAND